MTYGAQRNEEDDRSKRSAVARTYGQRPSDEAKTNGCGRRSHPNPPDLKQNKKQYLK